MFRRVLPVVAARCASASASSSSSAAATSTLAALSSTSATSTAAAAATSSSPMMAMASALLRRRSFAADSTSTNGGSPEQHKAPHGWGQTRVAELLESKGSDRGAWLWCSKDDYVIEAVRKMTQGNVGSLLVFDPAKAGAAGSGGAVAPGDAVVGIVTERDYLTKVVVQGKQSSSLHVREIMTARSKLLTVPPQSSVVDVMGLMVENNIRHVPVVEGGSFLGMVSIRDVVTTMLEEHREEVGRLHEYISGSY